MRYRIRLPASLLFHVTSFPLSPFHSINTTKTFLPISKPHLSSSSPNHYMAERNAAHLPPGFRFDPTDEELVLHFLLRKASLLPCHPDIIPDLDLYPYDPWQLDGKALAEGQQWYFYTRRAQNRVTGSGYWKPIGIDDPVMTSAKKKVGMKKYFVFYTGEGMKTDWIMEEYRLSDAASCSSSRSSKARTLPKIDYSKWVICRVYERNCNEDDDGKELSCLDEIFLSLDDLDEISLPDQLE